MRSQSGYQGYSHVQRSATGSPSFGQRYCPAQSPPAPGASNWLFGAHLSHLVPIPHLTVHLAGALPHSPTTLAYGSITHTPLMKGLVVIVW